MDTAATTGRNGDTAADYWVLKETASAGCRGAERDGSREAVLQRNGQQFTIFILLHTPASTLQVMSPTNHDDADDAQLREPPLPQFLVKSLLKWEMTLPVITSPR
ncbi:uncharacterized protein IUM83_19121 [Phytophthora cinnamomi]|uniref:uncharacterized protein n=1 Tax=Phytophthora cinnamomi TaxID=4785 RepID=UPI003559BA57|nr:hypothetical protein IUM83_19121 [Phytophthora cinnamomi]